MLRVGALLRRAEITKSHRLEVGDVLLDADEPVEAVVKVYRAALDGKDFRTLPEWASIEGMQTTTGHYFRGVE